MLEDKMDGTHLLVGDKFMHHASTFLPLDLIFDLSSWLMFTFFPTQATVGLCINSLQH